MKQKTKLQQHEQSATEQAVTQAAGAAEFRSAEEMVRFDALQTRVPDGVKSRLADSVAREPKAPPDRPWWKRLLP
jgi:hypothetical protein